jgi:hypothetical protein
MNHNFDIVKEGALRIIVVGGMAVGFGYLVFGSAVFKVHTTWFEFVANGITIAIAYMAFKSPRIRDSFVVLFFWYLFLIAFVFVPHNSWNPITEASYVVGLTVAVYFFFFLNGKHIINGWFQRIICVVLLVGFAHGLIVLFLEVISLRVFIHPLRSLDWSFMNLKSGTVIGILCGVGMELSERIVNSQLFRRNVIDKEFECSNCGGEIQKGDSICRSCGEPIEWSSELGSDTRHA